MSFEINKDAYSLLPVIINILKEKQVSIISGSEDMRSPEIVAEEIVMLNKEIEGLESVTEQANWDKITINVLDQLLLIKTQIYSIWYLI